MRCHCQYADIACNTIRTVVCFAICDLFWILDFVSLLFTPPRTARTYDYTYGILAARRAASFCCKLVSLCSCNHKNQERESKRKSMALPIPLYVPNLLGYARIFLAFLGLHYSQTQPLLACVLWIVSAFLDLIDGILARILKQCSSLGVLLDIAADNILRTTMWMAASADGSHQLMAALIISLEWTTMLCTQLHSTQSGTHWKTSREHDPIFVRAIFANNFKTLYGALCVYGLFFSGFFSYASHHQALKEIIPLFDFCKYLAFTGRGITFFAELWLCKGYLLLVVEKDAAAQSKNKQ